MFNVANSVWDPVQMINRGRYGCYGYSRNFMNFWKLIFEAYLVKDIAKNLVDAGGNYENMINTAEAKIC